MSNKNISSILKIITVDDSALIAERLKAMLVEMSVVQFLGNASNISEALNLINEEKPNVIILDINLKADTPEANGMDLLITVKKKYADIKIIMLTNLNHSQYRNACIALGADYFLDKTNDFEKIPETLAELFNINLLKNH